MSHNFKAILSPSTFLDSSCYSAEGFDGYPQIRPIPSAFDSDDYVDIRSDSDLSLSPSTMSQTPQSNTPAVGANMEDDKSGLPSLPGRKPPSPAIPRPVNVTAYTKPSHYGTYISSVLTPLSTNAARSSLTTIVDTEKLAFFRKENGHQFADHIAHEIKHRRKDASSTWIREVVFSAEAFPPDFKRTFQNSPIWNKNAETWARLPANLVEEHVENWLNEIVDTLGKAFNLFDDKGKAINPNCNRSWDKRTANSGPTGGTHYRKPDISLLNRTTRFSLKNDERPAWQMIQAFAEVTRSKRTFDNVVQNITEKAYLMFESQPFRRYVIALGFFGPVKDPKWALILIDRSGVVSSSQFRLKGPDGITLGHVIYALSFAKPTYIGIDETMTVSRFTGAVTHITVTGQTATSAPGKSVKRVFEVVRLLHSTSQVSGRATRVWLVFRKGRYCILKDSWPLESKPFSEIRHLLTINKTIMNDTKMRDALKHTYPILIVGQELGDSTEARRSEIPDKPFPRVHRRIVTKPVGDPLTSFRSKYELCSVLCDVVAFLKYSAETCRVCHGDISLNNIVINRVWDDDKDNDIGDDDDDIDDDDIDDDDRNSNNIENNKSGNSSRNLSSDNVSLNVVINESGSSKIAAPGEVYATRNSSNSEIASPVDLPTEPGPRSATITSQPSSTIKAYGLVIDNDNSFSLDDVAEFGYRINSGTLPFMALEALKWNVASSFTHEPKHDLESLFYVLITLCTYISSPGSLRDDSRRDDSIPEGKPLSVCLNEWWATFDRHLLARNKGAQLSSFYDYILQRLPPYWSDFHHVLIGLHSALWAKECAVLSQPNVATHDAFLKILIAARDGYRVADEEAYTFAPVGEAKPEKRIRQSSQKRKDSGEDIEIGAKRGKKRTALTIFPHRMQMQSFSSYADSGAPAVDKSQ